jgi:hypothetical protein
MALLSQQFRRVAITGRTDSVNAWFANRQGGRWAEQTVRSAFPGVDRSRELAELQRQGALTEAEAQALRARLET